MITGLNVLAAAKRQSGIAALSVCIDRRKPHLRNEASSRGEVLRKFCLCVTTYSASIFRAITCAYLSSTDFVNVLGIRHQTAPGPSAEWQRLGDRRTGDGEAARLPPASQGTHAASTTLSSVQQNVTVLLRIDRALLSDPQDALERAYQYDISRQGEEARRDYRTGIAAIHEGLKLQIPSAWLPGTNVSKLRSQLNSWLQLATDRYCTKFTFRNFTSQLTSCCRHPMRCCGRACLLRVPYMNCQSGCTLV